MVNIKCTGAHQECYRYILQECKEFFLNILKSAVSMSKALYPLLERELDLHTLGEKIKILLFQNL